MLTKKDLNNFHQLPRAPRRTPPPEPLFSLLPPEGLALPPPEGRLEEGLSTLGCDGLDDGGGLTLGDGALILLSG